MSYHAFIIGRNPSASALEVPIAINDPLKHVGSNHCRITYDNGNYYIEDLGSKNRTYVDGIPIHYRVQINSKSRITLGKKYEFSLDHPLIRASLNGNSGNGIVQPVEPDYAEWGSRFGAYILDDLFFTLLIIGPIYLAYAYISGNTIEESIVILSTILYIIGFFVVFHFYYAVTTNGSGQTWGKKILNVQVLDKDTREYPSKIQAWGRFLTIRIIVLVFEIGVIFAIHFANISWLIPGLLLLVTFFMPLWTEKKQCFHDMIANTIVTNTK